MSQEVSKRVSKWVIPPIYHYTPFIRGYNPDTSYLSCGFPTSYWTELHEWCGWGGACQRIPKKPCPPSNKKGERVVELGFCGIFRSVHGEHVLSIVILIGAATTSERCWKKKWHQCRQDFRNFRRCLCVGSQDWKGWHPSTRWESAT